MVRTRFAPSPTGFLHVGGVRTALYNYLFAKQKSGEFILRLEDTDRERFVPEGVEQIVEALDWLGLVPDDGFWISEGQHKNIDFVQSERHKRGDYLKVADALIAKGLAYYSPTSLDQLEALRETAKKKKRPFRYRKSDDKDNSSQKQEKTPIRLDTNAVIEKLPSLLKTGVPYPGIQWRDEVRNEFIVEDVNGIEDFILIKGDGFPTYNFANVIDDHEMKISHVIRGDEFIASTGRHVLLYFMFGWTPPVFVHLPAIMGSDGKKLSKRTGDTDVLDYRENGYLPEALLNFLALLGWNDGTEKEIFSLNELILSFKLEQLNSSPALFDRKRLDWMNGYYIRQLPLDELYERSKNFWPSSAHNHDDDYRKRVLGLVQERLKYFSELPKLTAFFFEELPIDLELFDGNKQLASLSRPEQRKLLQTSIERLSESDFSSEDLTSVLNKLLEEAEQKPAVLFSLIRIATTWAPASPGLAETLALLGKDRSLERLKKAVDSLN